MTCAWEEELLDSLGRGFIGAELEAHVASCHDCHELRLVAGALLDERSTAMAQAPVPNAGTMWWRMQMRHRQETQAIARRSLLIGQAITLAIAAFLVIALFGTHFVGQIRELATSIQFSTPILILATWILVAPIGGYFAVRQK